MLDSEMALIVRQMLYSTVTVHVSGSCRSRGALQVWWTIPAGELWQVWKCVLLWPLPKINTQVLLCLLRLWCLARPRIIWMVASLLLLMERILQHHRYAPGWV